MAKYLVQEFKWGKEGNTVFYGQQDEHNHKKSNEFTKAALDWLEAKAKWPRKEIEQGKFMSNQSKAPNGKELKWDEKKKKWEKV